MNTYTIKQICTMFEMPSSTLRYYEEAGLLTNIDRTPSGQRIFYDSHINRLSTICCFKNAGMTIAQLKIFFSYEGNHPDHFKDVVSLLSTLESSILAQIEVLQSSHVHVLKKLNYYSTCMKCSEEGRELPSWHSHSQSPES